MSPIARLAAAASLVGSVAALADVPPLPRGFTRVALSTTTIGNEPGTGAPIRRDEFVSGPVRMAPDGSVIAYTVESRTTYTAASPSYSLSTYTGYALFPQTGRTVNMGDLTATGVSNSGRFVCGVARGTYDSRTGYVSPPRGAFYDLHASGLGATMLAEPGYFPMGIYIETGGYPYSDGLSVPALDATLSGDALHVLPENHFPLPADTIPGTATQMQVSRTGLPMAATVQRPASGGGVESVGMFWHSLLTIGQYLPTPEGSSSSVTAMTPAAQFILGRYTSVGVATVCYWTHNAAASTYSGPFTIPDAPGAVFNPYTFLDGTDDGSLFVGYQSGLFNGVGVVNTPAATTNARTYFASTYPALPQPTAEQGVDTVAAVAQGGVVFTGVGTTIGSGGFPTGPSYLWVFNRVCGRADVGRAGGLAGPDGLLDNNDFIAFIDLFFASDPRADMGSAGGLEGSDGAWDNNDFIAFISLFFSGC